MMALKQAEKIFKAIKEMIAFVQEKFRWEDFEIEAFGSGSARFWSGCIIEEESNVYVKRDGFGYKIMARKTHSYGYSYDISGYVKFRCESFLSPENISEHFIVFHKMGFWVSFRKIE